MSSLKGGSHVWSLARAVSCSQAEDLRLAASLVQSTTRTLSGRRYVARRTPGGPVRFLHLMAGSFRATNRPSMMERAPAAGLPAGKSPVPVGTAIGSSSPPPRRAEQACLASRVPLAEQPQAAEGSAGPGAAEAHQ